MTELKVDVYQNLSFSRFTDYNFSDRAATRQCLVNGTWATPDYRKCREIYFNMPYCIEVQCERVRKPD